MKRTGFLVAFSMLLLAAPAETQVRRRVPAPSEESGDFGSKFFDDLRNLFGRLQQSELARAFQRAKPARCSELVDEKGEWKQVAFLNDDRRLGDWHFDSIDEVKHDLTTFVFSGTCRSEEGPIKIASSYPVRETIERFQQGRIPLSQVVMTDNDPVSVVFDHASDAYTFQLPYLYIERKDGSGLLYTLTPPLTTSRPEKDVAEEFRCKALSDAQLTYRFLLCRTRVVDRNPQVERQRVPQPLGNAAYYILSDGKEASSTVKLSFGPETDSKAEETAPQPALPAQPGAVDRAFISNAPWRHAAAQDKLTDIEEFRFRFKPETWKGQIEKPQLLMDGNLSNVTQTTAPPRNKSYCEWRPGWPDLVSKLVDHSTDDSFLYAIEFRKELQTTTSAVFEIQDDKGLVIGVLQCYFPQSQTPADLTIAKWSSIVGQHLEIELH